MNTKDKLSTTGKRKSRLKTIEARYKKVRSLERELDEIHDQIYNLGYTILEKPLRDGWNRTLSLRPDIAKHKKANIYQEILDKTVQVFWGREKKYADKAWKKHYDEYGHLYFRHDIRYLRTKAYLSLSSKAKKYFTKVKVKYNYRYRRVYICNLPRYYFVTKYERAYITKRKIIAPQLESRAKEIENKLSSPKYYLYYDYNIYHNKWYFNPNRRRRRKTNAALQSLDFHYLESLGDKEYCW